MVNRNVVAAKLAELDLRIERIVKHRAISTVELAANADALDLVAFNLMLAVQICADIASHIISDAGWPSARTLGDAFERLAQHGVVTQPTSAALARAVGLRNVVAHGYAGVDVDLVHAAASHGIADLKQFGREVARWVGSQP
jgi:uncharacterized protein YutE (UPF0331/DUF86 family)